MYSTERTSIHTQLSDNLLLINTCIVRSVLTTFFSITGIWPMTEEGRRGASERAPHGVQLQQAGLVAQRQRVRRSFLDQLISGL